ncbi:MAG: hypothetical protein AAFO63_00990 [Pseudomonadota bacterium]
MRGLLPGNDDFMRLQQIRDLLAGQAWFDVSQSRILSPEGGAMHWSRLPDLPVALLILILSPVFGGPLAEALSVTIWPIALAMGCLVMIAKIVERVGLPMLAQACALVCFLGPASIGNFTPGRIDHHGLLIFLTLVGFAALVSRDRTRQSAIVFGVVVALLATTALEGLIYAVILIGLLGLSWIAAGHHEAERMTLIGGTIFLSAPILFLLDAPGPWRGVSQCDAYGFPYMSALMIGGALLIALAIFASRFIDVRHRLGFGLLAGAVTLAVFAQLPPGCLGDPYATLPDSVREMWLNNVSEAQNMFQASAVDLSLAVSRYGFISVGLIAAIVLLANADQDDRLSRFLLLCALMAMAILSAWQIRGASFAASFAAISAGGLIGQLLYDWRKKRGGVRAAAAFAGVLLLAPGNWGVFGDRLEGPVGNSASPKPSTTCREPAFYKELDALTPARIMAPVDLGTILLIHTKHQVYAGPYHRNPQGIEAVGSIYSAPADQSLLALSDVEAEYLLFCPGLGETNQYLKNAKLSLAARIDRGESIDWLDPIRGESGLEGKPVLYKISYPQTGN